MAWNTAEIYNSTTKQFTALSGRMTTNRAQHTANLLSDGTVLLAGGLSNSGTISSAEIYNPSTSSFAATGSLHSPRNEHTATSIADGTVLITGGFFGSSSNAQNSAEIYNPVSHQFTLTGNMTVPRAYHSATMLFNGNILIAGGLEATDNSNGYLSSAEIYSYTVAAAVLGPLYKVTSIIYAPPGNKSQDGYTSTTSNATTTSIGSSFTSGHTITTTFGFSVAGVGGITASQSFGTSSTSSNMDAFQESFTNATGVANQSNSTQPDAINHNNDLFLIWLNPEIIAFGDATAQGPVGFGVGIQPLSDGTVPPPDIVEVTADAMEANAAGMTSVPASTLNQENLFRGWLLSARISLKPNTPHRRVPLRINAGVPLTTSCLSFSRIHFSSFRAYPIRLLHILQLPAR
jgi:Kelch motif/Galactose oxidase, central domain